MPRINHDSHCSWEQSFVMLEGSVLQLHDRIMFELSAIVNDDVGASLLWHA